MQAIRIPKEFLWEAFVNMLRNNHLYLAPSGAQLRPGGHVFFSFFSLFACFPVQTGYRITRCIKHFNTTGSFLALIGEADLLPRRSDQVFA